MAEYDIAKYGWPIVRKALPEAAGSIYSDFYETETATGGVTYKRFEDTNPCVIWKETVTTSGGQTNTKLEFGWGDWSDRTNISYAPINGSVHVTYP